MGGAPSAMRGEHVEAAGTRLYVRRWGPGGGPPLVFLHSLGPAASGALLGPGVGPLAEAGYAVAAPDAPGFGLSPALPPGRYEVPRLAELAWAAADALGWERLVLSGHSWGGSVAVHAAAAHPARVRALILVDSGHLDYVDQPGAALAETLEELTEKADAARIRTKDRASIATDLELPIDDPVVDAFLEGLTDDGEGGLISRIEGSSRAAAMYHLMRARPSEQWAAIDAARIPTLLLLGTKPDELRTTNQAAAARFAAVVPQADIRFLDASHSLITDMRGEFGRIAADWLATLG
jgi:pimeloyl-ACP methyl ester carboxylesterase